MTMNVVRPTTNIDKHIKVLESLIAFDKKNKDMKSLRYHKQALKALEQK